MASQTRKLNKDQWQSFFDNLSSHLKAQKVTILVEGLDLGVQTEVERALLNGITYDASDDAIEIATDAVQHRIQQPSELYVQETAGGALAAIKMTDADGHEQIVQLEASLALPAAH